MASRLKSFACGPLSIIIIESFFARILVAFLRRLVCENPNRCVMALIKFHSSQPLLSKTLTPCLCPKSVSNYGAHLNHVHCVTSEGEQMCAWAQHLSTFSVMSVWIPFIIAVIYFFDDGSSKVTHVSVVQIRCSSFQALHKLSWYVWEGNTCKWQATSCSPTVLLNQFKGFLLTSTSV